MTVCLITALNIADLGDPEITVRAHQKQLSSHLGVLTLAAALRSSGLAPQVINLDRLFLAFLEERRTGLALGLGGGTATVAAVRQSGGLPPGPYSYFFPFLAEHLASLTGDIFALSSICSTYPLTLRLAEQLRRLHPVSTIIMGGPQASAVDVPTVAAFPYVDIIVRGEADEIFPELVERLLAGEASTWQSMPGITFRRGEQVIRNPDAPVVRNLDRLPLPAFDLDPFLHSRGAIQLELGRGCPFSCTFCATSDFFRRRYRLKSPLKILAEMRQLHQSYGVDHFNFVHDLYTIDRKKVVAFCRELIEGGDGFVWSCSARTDCIDDELIALMAEAGCQGIFFGLETGSHRMQQAINKKLDLAEAWRRIECADRNGIETSVSMIIGFPDETHDELRATVHAFVNALRLNHSEPQISLLAPLAGTPIHKQYRDALVFDRIFSDMSEQGWRQDPVEVAMIEAHPEIFPNFYAVPTLWLGRGYLGELAEFLTYVATWFRWLPVALLQDSGDFLAIFDHWRAWRAARRAQPDDEDPGLAPYYAHRRFRKEFQEFLQERYIPDLARAATALTALVQAEGSGDHEPGSGELFPLGNENHGNRCVPVQRRGLCLVDLAVDYGELVECLRQSGDLAGVPQAAATIAFLPVDGRRTQVWQLAPLSAALLKLCDGVRTVEEILDHFSHTVAPCDGVTPEQAGLFGLAQLRRDGFIA